MALYVYSLEFTVNNIVQIADNLRYRLKSRYSGIKNSPEIFLKNGFEIKRGSCFPDGSHPRHRGSEILEKNTWKFFFGKSSHRYLSPSFDGERGGIWGANGEGGGLYTPLVTK